MMAPSVPEPRRQDGHIESGGCGRVAFRFHARALAALGRDLVTDDVVAIMELVKNAYDALATRVDVRIRSGDGIGGDGYIEVVDDGHGMDYITVRDVWFTIGTPFRQKGSAPATGALSRVATGEKGLGRLSAARLGREIRLTTKTKGCTVCDFSLNWDDLLQGEDVSGAEFEVTELPPAAFEKSHGTRVRIGGLRSHWDEHKINDLRESLGRLISPFAEVKDFTLHLDVTDDQGGSDIQSIAPPQFMLQPKYAIQGSVEVDGTIRATYRHSPIDGRGRREREFQEPWKASRDALREENHVGVEGGRLECGPFVFEIRAWDLTKDDTRDIAEHFSEKRRHVRAAIASQKGVAVYRDDVLALPKSDGARDWIGLDVRRISRVGNRLSTNQIVGYVRITKAGNPELRDTSDREGLMLNPAAVAFRNLVKRIVELLEIERHKDRMEAKDKGTATELFSDLSAEPLLARLEELRDSGADMADAVEAAKEFGDKLEQTRTVIEKRFGYYSRLAVIGIIAQLVIHEILSRTTVIGRGLRKAGKLAKRVRDEVTVQALDMARGSVTALEALADRFAPLASRSYRPGHRISVVEESVGRCIDMLSPEIRSGRIAVETEFDMRTAVRIDPAELDTILLNLLTNALYWLRRRDDGERRLRFRLTPGPTTERVTISLDDSGPGVDPDERNRVFWPGVTHKPDGIGMGLTVASELVDGHGGRMRTIVPGSLGGGTFEFDLPLAENTAERGRS